jgi:hypothetical protein
MTDFRVLCQQIDSSLARLVHEREFPEQPDARAFGAYVEQAALGEWGELCSEWSVEPRDHPGRRTIYDASFVAEGVVIGVDFRTKDLADNRYSDGGICAVGNLLRFMVRESATLVITEFGYAIEDGVATFDYVVSAPIHALPIATYRIENLGTGQLRLNDSIHDCASAIAWERSTEEFFAEFAPLCIKHYGRVKERADLRIKSVEDFIASEFKAIALR